MDKYKLQNGKYAQNQKTQIGVFITYIKWINMEDGY